MDLQLGAFPTARATTAIDPNRFRRADLVAPTRGVRLHLGLADDRFERVHAFGLVLGPDQVISHVTAALVMGWPLPRRFEAVGAPIHVSTLGRGPLMRRRGSSRIERIRHVSEWSTGAGSASAMRCRPGTRAAHSSVSTR
jgi:hypothetical protein